MLRAYANGALFGETFGTAPPWVLGLHGWARAHEDLVGVVAPTGASALDALLVDLPGFGSSPPPPRGWTTGEYAQALEAVLVQCAERVVVLGHSFGGRVALHLAARVPDRVAALVLTGVPLPPADARRRRPALGFRLARGLRRAGIVSEARLEAARDRFGSRDYRLAEGVMREVLVRCVGESYDGLVAATACPIELVWGARDEVAPLALARRAAGLRGAVELTVVEGADHFLPARAPGALREAIERHRPR